MSFIIGRLKAFVFSFNPSPRFRLNFFNDILCTRLLVPKNDNISMIPNGPNYCNPNEHKYTLRLYTFNQAIMTSKMVDLGSLLVLSPTELPSR